MSKLKQEQTEKFLDFIDDDFFIGIVENKLNIKRDEFKLKLVLLEPATGKNENYTSVLYRAKIKIELTDGSKQTVQVIVKAMLDFLPPEFKQFNVFYRERRMYEILIPALESECRNVGIDVEFGPKSVKFETEPYEILVLDDLCFNKYKMQDRKVGVDLDHAKLVYSKLAKFHAASAMHFEKVGNIYSELDRIEASKAQFDPNTPNPMIEGIKNIVVCFIEHVKSWPGFENYGELLDKWDSNKALTSFVDVANPLKNGFQVLNHADLWVNNFMFKYADDGKPIDVKFIDYQGSFWGSPVNDLIYFYVSSIRDDIKIESFDYFIEFYHTELVANLKRLGYEKPIPTLDELHIDLLEKGAFLNVCLLFILFVVKYDGVEEIAIEDLMKYGEDQKRVINAVYKVDNYKNAVQLLLPFLKRRGYLDCMINKDSMLLKQ